MYGFVGPDNYELCHDILGPDGCGVYCVSRCDVGVVPHWDGDEEGDVYEGDVDLYRSGSDEAVHSVVSTISPGGPCDVTGWVADAPGDVIVVSSECRDIDKGTLDSLRICCGPSHSIIIDEGVFAFDLYPPGMMCKLDCPWLSAYLFVSFGGWLVSSRE